MRAGRPLVTAQLRVSWIGCVGSLTHPRLRSSIRWRGAVMPGYERE